jgi:uncharacterized protein YycO
MLLGALSEGVCITAPKASDKISHFTVPGLDMEAAVSAARTQLGKPYDWGAIVGIALHRDWRAPDKWFCSELVAWACEQAGTKLLRFDNLDRVTPGQLALSPLLQLEGA